MHPPVSKTVYPALAPTSSNVVQLSDILKDPSITDSYVILATEALQHQDMLDYLNQSSLGYVEVEGGYLMDNGDFITERSVIVASETSLKLAHNGWTDTQESFLHLYNKDHRNWYRAELIYLDGRDSKDLGHLMQVSEEVALASPNGYTFRPNEAGNFDDSDGQYYTTVKKG